MDGTPESGRGRDVIPPGGRLKTRARTLFGSAKVDGRVVAKGLIMRNPAVTRKGDESHRNELLGSDRGLLGCSYCGAVECGTKKMI